MNKHLEEACENVDASIFSGEALWVEEDFAALKEYLGRWNRAVAEHEALEAKEDEQAADQLDSSNDHQRPKAR